MMTAAAVLPDRSEAEWRDLSLSSRRCDEEDSLGYARDDGILALCAGDGSERNA